MGIVPSWVWGVRAGVIVGPGRHEGTAQQVDQVLDLELRRARGPLEDPAGVEGDDQLGERARGVRDVSPARARMLAIASVK